VWSGETGRSTGTIRVALRTDRARQGGDHTRRGDLTDGVIIFFRRIEITAAVDREASWPRKERRSAYASVIEAKQCRPNKHKDGSSTQDPDAAWNVKAGSDGKRKSTYGYKAHINVDEDGFIKATDYSTGSLHDSNCFTDLLSGTESAVYADSAYLSQTHEDWLSSRGIDSRVIKRAYRNRPLSDKEKCFNRTHSGVRCTVERVFGVLKQHYGMAKARYLGLSRNRTRFELMCIAHNMKRGVSIQQESYV
jgi:IS5 family transposase